MVVNKSLARRLLTVDLPMLLILAFTLGQLSMRLKYCSIW